MPEWTSIPLMALAAFNAPLRLIENQLGVAIPRQPHKKPVQGSKSSKTPHPAWLAASREYFPSFHILYLFFFSSSFIIRGLSSAICQKSWACLPVILHMGRDWEAVPSPDQPMAWIDPMSRAVCHAAIPHAQCPTCLAMRFHMVFRQ